MARVKKPVVYRGGRVVKNDAGPADDDDMRGIRATFKKDFPHADFDDELAVLAEMDQDARDMWNNDLRHVPANELIRDVFLVLSQQHAFSVMFGRLKREKVERRVAELEHKSFNLADADRGVWKEGESYRQGEVVTFSGSLWICKSATTSRPGTDDTFRLAVKRGRPARHDRSAT